MGERRRRVGVAEAVVSRAAAPVRRSDEEIDPAFHRAILKIAIELKKPNARSYEAVVEETIRAMRLDPTAFRRYLGENGARGMSLLLATARGPGL